MVKAHELLKPDAEVQSKRRLAFAKAHANQLWPGDTMFGPYVCQDTGKATGLRRGRSKDSFVPLE